MRNLFDAQYWVDENSVVDEKFKNKITFIVIEFYAILCYYKKRTQSTEIND